MITIPNLSWGWISTKYQSQRFVQTNLKRIYFVQAPPEEKNLNLFIFWKDFKWLQGDVSTIVWQFQSWVEVDFNTIAIKVLCWK